MSNDGKIWGNAGEMSLHVDSDEMQRYAENRRALLSDRGCFNPDNVRGSRLLPPGRLLADAERFWKTVSRAKKQSLSSHFNVENGDYWALSNFFELEGREVYYESRDMYEVMNMGHVVGQRQVDVKSIINKLEEGEGVDAALLDDIVIAMWETDKYGTEERVMDGQRRILMLSFWFIAMFGLDNWIEQLKKSGLSLRVRIIMVDDEAEAQNLFDKLQRLRDSFSKEQKHVNKVFDGNPIDVYAENYIYEKGIAVSAEEVEKDTLYYVKQSSDVADLMERLFGKVSKDNEKMAEMLLEDAKNGFKKVEMYNRGLEILKEIYPDQAVEIEKQGFAVLVAVHESYQPYFRSIKDLRRALVEYIRDIYTVKQGDKRKGESDEKIGLTQAFCPKGVGANDREPGGLAAFNEAFPLWLKQTGRAGKTKGNECWLGKSFLTETMEAIKGSLQTACLKTKSGK